MLERLIYNILVPVVDSEVGQYAFGKAISTIEGMPCYGLAEDVIHGKVSSSKYCVVASRGIGT